MDLGSLNTKDIVRIMAYAGTGKTTTLLELTRRHPNTEFLLIVFNKSVQIHSNNVFPKNVTVRTANSLSHQYIMKTKGKERFQNWNIKSTDLISKYLIPKRNMKSPYAPFNLHHWAAMIIDTIYRFCNSSDRSLALDHAPTHWKLRKGEKIDLEKRHKDFLLEDSKEIWKKIRHSRVLKYDHTTSMKEFQLSEPDLKDYVDKVDLVLLDEAQDMNPCMLTVCLNQEVPKIVVGDNFQQIYGFRGAVNALELISQTENGNLKETYYLSQSFRFGAEIAFAAECCLKHLLGASGPSIVGTSKRDSVTGYLPGHTTVRPEARLAIIGRTNLALFSEMVRLVCSVEKHLRPKIGFPTGSGGRNDPLGFKKLIELSHRKAVTNHWEWKKFVSEVEASNDNEMIGKIKIVEKYGIQVPKFVEILEQQTSNIDDPGVKFVFSTVHKFKGLEMENVRLLDDFFYDGLPYTRPALQGVEREELNMLYVALTRGKSLVMMNDALYFLLTSRAVDSCHEMLREPPLLPTSCVLCGGTTEQYQSPAVLWQKPLTILHNMKRSAGFLCSVCAWASERRVLHTAGGLRYVQAIPEPVYKVPKGIVDANNHSWLRSILTPHDANPVNMRNAFQGKLLANPTPRDLVSCDHNAAVDLLENLEADLAEDWPDE